MKLTIRRLALASVLLTALAVPTAQAFTSSAVNWSTGNDAVVCGIAARVYGTHFDPGTGAPLNGYWPGLQCSAQGIPRPAQPIGDPFVQLGQGRAGRARLVDLSQDDLLSSAPAAVLEPGSTWKRDGITCRVKASSIRCNNGAGHGFTLSPGHVNLY